MRTGRPAIPAELRFWEKVAVGSVGECWPWLGSVSRGYGQMWFQCGAHKMIRAHKFSWLLHKGSVPAGKWVLHKCDNPLCVNPAHLYAGTAKDNSDDMVRRGRANYVGCPKGLFSGEKNPMYGRRHTAKARRLISEARRG